MKKGDSLFQKSEKVDGPLFRFTSWLLVALAGILLWRLLSVWAPSDIPSSSLCFFQRVLDVRCPGCGLTRALAHSAKGQWSTAFAHHPLAPVIVAEAPLLWLGWGLILAGQLRTPGRHLLNRWLAAHLVAFVLVWFFRLSVSGTLL